MTKILIIEDYDSIFDGRKNISKSLKGDFRDLLEIVDKFKGVILITTNNKDSIDPAIGVLSKGITSRPGRINRIVYMSNPTEEIKIKMSNFILGRVDKEIMEVGKNDSYAQFTERLSEKAVEEMWADREKKDETN